MIHLDLAPGARAAGLPVVDDRQLNLAHTRMVIDDAIAHAKRALTAAECNQVPQPTQDALFIALTRLQSAKAACKE